MIHAVFGHICSGKSTFVREHAGPDDVVIDMDRIALALSSDGTEHHQYKQAIRDIARIVRWFAIDEAIRMHRAKRIRDVWIVHAYPSESDVARYRRLGAAIKQMEADAATLRARAKAERPPQMQEELERRLSGAAKVCVFPGKTAETTPPGVGSAAKVKIDGRPHGRSARVSGEF